MIDKQTDFDEPVQTELDAYEWNKPQVGALYFYTHEGQEMALIVCEILEEEVELPSVKKVMTWKESITGTLVPEAPRLAYELMILLNMPHLEKVKYHRITMSHERWHRCVKRKV